jgi:hypothetical protein
MEPAAERVVSELFSQRGKEQVEQTSNSSANLPLIKQLDSRIGKTDTLVPANEERSDYDKSSCTSFSIFVTGSNG